MAEWKGLECPHDIRVFSSSWHSGPSLLLETLPALASIPPPTPAPGSLPTFSAGFSSWAQSLQVGSEHPGAPLTSSCLYLYHLKCIAIPAFK